MLHLLLLRKEKPRTHVYAQMQIEQTSKQMNFDWSNNNSKLLEFHLRNNNFHYITTDASIQ